MLAYLASYPQEETGLIFSRFCVCVCVCFFYVLSSFIYMLMTMSFWLNISACIWISFRFQNEKNESQFVKFRMQPEIFILSSLIFFFFF